MSTGLGFAPRLQRQCACGGRCPACQAKKQRLQKKGLQIGAGGDRFEQEADRVARQVLDWQPRPGVESAPVRVQRAPTQVEADAGVAPPLVESTLARPGRALDAATRTDFEARFGHDLGAVRVHDDPGAAASAEAVGARAYTVGSHLVFGPGAYAPHSRAGRELLAHELTHVLQQGQGVLRREERASDYQAYSPKVGTEFEALSLEEVEADPLRSAAFAHTHAKLAQLYASANTDAKPVGLPLRKGERLTLQEVHYPGSRSQSSGAWYPKGGAGWFKLARKDPAGQSGYALGVLLREIEVKKVEVKQKKETKPAAPLIDLQFFQEVPEQWVIQRPIDIDSMMQDPQRRQWSNVDNQELRKALEALQSGGKLMKDMPLPMHFSTEIVVPDGKSAQQAWIDLGTKNPFLIAPWAQPVFSPVLDLKPGPQRIFVFVDNAPEKSFEIDARKNAIFSIVNLADYLKPEAAPAAAASTDVEQAKRLQRIQEKRLQFDWAWRQHFDRRHFQQLDGWEALESALDDALGCQERVFALLKTRPRQTSGTRLDKILSENAQSSEDIPQAERPAFERQAATLHKEQDRRKGIVDDARKRAAVQAELLRKNVLSRVDMQAQTNMLGAIFGDAFVAGARYEIAPANWDEFGQQIVDNPLAFNGGIYAGMTLGALEGVVDAFVGLIDLATMLAKAAWKLTVWQAETYYNMIFDWEALQKSSEAQEALGRELLSGARDLINAFMEDPAFLSGPAFDLGHTLGRSTGDWFNSEFMPLSPFDKGSKIGWLLGRVIIEIVMLIVAPEELILKAGAASKVGGLVAKMRPVLEMHLERLIKKVPALEGLLKAKGARKAAGAADELHVPGGKLPEAPHAPDAPKAPDAPDAPKTPELGKTPDAPAGKSPAKAAAGKADEVLAIETVNANHHVEVNDRGICLCSDPPCGRIKDKLAPELKARKDLDTRLDLAESTRFEKPRAAAKEGRDVVHELAEDAQRGEWFQTLAKNPEKLRDLFAPVLKQDKKLAQKVEKLVKKKPAPQRELDELLRELREAQLKLHAKPLPKAKGTEVFDELSSELGLGGKGTDNPVKDAEAAGLMKPDLKPGTADAAVQPHRNASEIRDAADKTGKDLQSAHVNASSFLRDVDNYSREGALTWLMEPATHRVFDDYWKFWAKTQRSNGRTQCTVDEMRKIMHEAIERIPAPKTKQFRNSEGVAKEVGGLEARQKGTLGWMLDLEIEKLGLKGDDLIELPYANFKKGDKVDPLRTLEDLAP